MPRVLLITGGIGAAVARSFAATGGRVDLQAYRRPPAPFPFPSIDMPRAV